MNEVIRIAQTNDVPTILTIYTPYIVNSVASFELEPPTIEQMQQRMQHVQPALPWLVIERDHQVIGYAYASKHKERLSYQWSVDASIYLDSSVHRQGLGRKLYRILFNILNALGYYNVYAGITMSNTASIKLHEALGFQLIGVYQNVGYKHGAWRDVGWWGLTLRPHDGVPVPPRSFAALQESGELEKFLNPAE